MGAAMRIGHTGDWHLEEGPRFERTYDTLRWMIRKGAEMGVELWLVGGDLYNSQTRPMRPRERLALAELLTEMAEKAPVVLAYGNHDYPGELEIFEKLLTNRFITVASKPVPLRVPCGFKLASVCVLPYPHKRAFALHGGIAEENQQARAALGEIIESWNVGDDSTNPRILLYHGNVAGSRVAGGEQMIGREVELSRHHLDEGGFDYCALSHIHLSQQVGEKAWYAGSPERSNFGETDEKGFLVVDVERGKAPIVQRWVTPCVELVTIETVWDGRDLRPWILKSDPAQLEIRVLVEVEEQHVATLPDIAAMIGPCISLKVEKRVKPRERIRSAEIVKARTDAEKIEAYWQSLGPQAPSAEDRALALKRLGE